METGDTAHVGGYEFRFDGVTQVPGPNYTAARGSVSVTRNGRLVTVLTPEKRAYFSQQMPMTDASISRGLTRDLYVSLGEPVGDAWIVRVYYKPFVDWIWAGWLLMAFGGFMAFSDRRYRLAQRQAILDKSASMPAAGAA